MDGLHDSHATASPDQVSSLTLIGEPVSLSRAMTGSLPLPIWPGRSSHLPTQKAVIVPELSPELVALLEDCRSYIAPAIGTHEEISTILGWCDCGYCIHVPHYRRCLAKTNTTERAVSVLRDLVNLKDGPRDGHYRAAKDEAWARARAIISGNAVNLGTEEN